MCSFKMKVLWIAITCSLFWGVCGVEWGHAASYVSTPVSGIYGLGRSNAPIARSIIDNPNLAGVSLRFSWNFLEPAEGVLDTDLLLDEIARAKAVGKKIQLRVIPGARTPAWVYAKGVPSMQFSAYDPGTGLPTGEVNRIPVPWDPEYLTAWTSFIGRLGALIGAEPGIVLVHMTGANSNSGELHLASGSDSTDPTTQYLDDHGIVVATGAIVDLFINSAGYSLDNILMSWATSREAWAAAFPAAKLTYDIVSSILKNDGIPDEVERIVADAAALYPNRLTLQLNSFKDDFSLDPKLASTTYQIIQSYLGTIDTGFQSLESHGSCSGTTTTGDLGPALAVGTYLYGADYFELYTLEIQRYPLVVQECNNFLLGAGTRCGTAGPLLCQMDFVPPTVSITAPTEGATLSGDTSVTVKTSDNTLVLGVTLLADGAEVVPEQIIAPPASDTFSLLLNTQTLSVGPHILTALARDVSGNTATATLNVLVQSIDVIPPVISGTLVSGITTTGAVVTWTTNEPATSEVIGATPAFSASLVTAHSLTLTGLLAETTYSVTVRSSDAAGNTATSIPMSFTTLLPPDVTPPVLSAVAVSGITTTRAVVTWTTNEAATTEVIYGTITGTTTGTITVSAPGLVTSHSKTLTRLKAGTAYSVTVRSGDTAGNTTTSTPVTFTTLSKLGRP